MTRAGNYQSGFSIIELMVALLLGATLLLGVLQIFDATKRSAQVVNALARAQESGRIAMEVLARDIRMADHWGCTPDSSEIFDHLDKDHGDYESWMDLANATGLSGDENVAAGTTMGTITVKPDTDTLTLRGAVRRHNVRVEWPYMTVASATIHINTGVKIPKGEVLLISDCNNADLFANTHTNTASGNIIHNTGGSLNAFKNMSQTYTADAQILSPFVKTYFIGEPVAGVWSLYREQNGDINELVRDVEDLQIVYGEDTNGDGSVDTFQDADGVGDMSDVISVRVTLEVNSKNSVPGNPITRTYSMTANIRNRSL
jgi:type IV pilus assembly protein PilW